MTKITFKNDPLNTSGELPGTGRSAYDFTLTGNDMIDYNKADIQKNGNIVLNIFPSLDTSVCAATVRRFNESAASLENTKVLCISMDLPFAQARFCGAEGIENVRMLSAFRHPEFGKDYGIDIIDGPLAGLLARAVVVIDPQNRIIHSELVPEIAQEPDYQAALQALQG